jgi:hypothetical protein
MIVKKGQLLNVNHNRSGKWVGIATKDFDTEKEEWYPIALAQEKPVRGLARETIWESGDSMPCRNTLCFITIKE